MHTVRKLWTSVRARGEGQEGRRKKLLGEGGRRNEKCSKLLPSWSHKNYINITMLNVHSVCMCAIVHVGNRIGIWINTGIIY